MFAISDHVSADEFFAKNPAKKTKPDKTFINCSDLPNYCPVLDIKDYGSDFRNYDHHVSSGENKA